MALDGHDDAFGGMDYSRPDDESSRNEEENISSGEDTKSPSLVEVKEKGGGAYVVRYPGGGRFRSPPRKAEEKRKVGFTFRESVAERLGAFQAVLSLGGEEVPKNEIVEAALELFLRDYETGGEESRAVRWMRRRLK